MPDVSGRNILNSRDYRCWLSRIREQHFTKVLRESCVGLIASMECPIRHRKKRTENEADASNEHEATKKWDRNWNKRARSAFLLLLHWQSAAPVRADRRRRRTNVTRRVL